MAKPYGKIYKNKVNVSIDATDLYNVWPVGSIYISVINVNPSNYFGGTWEQFANGRTLVGVDTSQTEFNSVEKTGGEATHKLTIDEMPSHNHNAYLYGGNLASTSGRLLFETGAGQEFYNSIKSTGGDQPHNNLQPYITVYMWKRIS